MSSGLFSYITPEGLQAFARFKYSGVDKSLCTKYLLSYYWNAVVKLVPMWVAPNLLTLMGFFATLIPTLIFFFLNPNLEEEPPRWLFFALAFGIFAYQTFDAIDGKQARRTGTSSPLGQLFDHGVDSLNIGLIVIVFVGTVRMGSSWAGVGLFFAPLFLFYFITLEEYHTHVLYLGPINGPVEGTLIIVGAFIYFGFAGTEILDTELVGGLDIRGGIVVAFWILAVLTGIGSWSNIKAKWDSANGSAVAVLGRQLIPYVLYIAGCIVFMVRDPDGVFSAHPTEVYLVAVLIHNYLTMRLILAKLAAMPIPEFADVACLFFLWGAALFPYSLITRVASNIAHVFVVSLLVGLGLQLFHFTTTVNTAITAFLGIRTFSITPKTVDNPAEEPLIQPSTPDGTHHE